MTKTKTPAATKATAKAPAATADTAFRAATPAELEALAALGKEGTWQVGGHELKLTNLDKPLFDGRGDQPGPITKRDLIGYLLRDITLPPVIWSRVTWSWTAFFAAMAVLNRYVAVHYSTDTWVNFKVWGGIGLFLLFAVAQGLFLARYMTEPSKS